MQFENLNQFVFSPLSDSNSSILSYYEKIGLNLENIEAILKTLKDNYPNSAIKTYIDAFGLENISAFEDSYIGQFESEDEIEEKYDGEYLYEDNSAFAI